MKLIEKGLPEGFTIQVFDTHPWFTIFLYIHGKCLRSSRTSTTKGRDEMIKAYKREAKIFSLMPIKKPEERSYVE